MSQQVHEHTHEHAGHDRHAGHGAHGEMFRRRFWVSLILSVPVVVFSHMVAELFGYHLPDVPASSGSHRCWAPSSSSTAACRS